jgi:hypothetical protein
MIYNINKKLILEFSWNDLDKPLSDSNSKGEHINQKVNSVQSENNDSKLIKSTYKMNIDKLNKNSVSEFKKGFESSIKGAF